LSQRILLQDDVLGRNGTEFSAT